MADHRVVPQGEVLFPSGAAPNIEILSPLAGAQWPIGSRQTIRWVGCTNVCIRLRQLGDSGFDWDLEALGRIWYQPNGTSLEIDVSGPAGTSYYIQVRDYSDPLDRSAVQVASGFFAITGSGQPLLNPEILSIDPSFVAVGDYETEISIYGTDFGTSGYLHMGDGSTYAKPLTIVSWSTNKIVFTVPADAGFGVGAYTIWLHPSVPPGNEVSWPFNIGDTAPPPLPDPTGTTIKKIVAMVNERLGNHVRWGTHSLVADGRTRHFHMPDQFVRELPANHPDVFTLTFYDADGNVSGGEVEGGGVDEDGNPVEVTTSSTNWGSFDYTNNWYHFTIAPAKGTNISFDYSYQWWPESMIRRFVNSALLYLADKFYVTHVRDYAVTGNEYVIEHGGAPAKGIVEVQYGSEGDWTRLTPFRDYRVLRGDRQECLLQVFGSVTGTLRVRAAYDPMLFRQPTDTIESLQLPLSIVECIVLYCCWQCLLQFLPPRMRYDQAIVTQGAGTPTVRDNQSTPQIYKMLLDVEVEQRKMRPWTSRGL